MLPKVCHAGFFKEPFTCNNNLQSHLNPIRVEPKEEKYDIESNDDGNNINLPNSKNVTIVKYKTCCSRQQLFEYIVVAGITSILLIAILYIIHLITNGVL